MSLVNDDSKIKWQQLTLLQPTVDYSTNTNKSRELYSLLSNLERKDICLRIAPVSFLVPGLMLGYLLPLPYRIQERSLHLINTLIPIYFL
jgi:hypothetical protein